MESLNISLRLKSASLLCPNRLLCCSTSLRYNSMKLVVLITLFLDFWFSIVSYGENISNEFPIIYWFSKLLFKYNAITPKSQKVPFLLLQRKYETKLLTIINCLIGLKNSASLSRNLIILDGRTLRTGFGTG